MNILTKQVQQASDILTCMKANPAYNEYNMWRQNISNGVYSAIPEHILDTVLEGDKSTFSLLINQMSFIDDAQKESIKDFYNQTETEALNNLKSDLKSKGLLVQQ